MRGLLLALVLVGAAEAKPPEPGARKVEVRIVDGGEFAEVRAENGRLRVRTTAGGEKTRERAISPEERARLETAARAALAQDDVRRGCGGVGELFVTVTVDDKTLFNAVCDTSPNEMVSQWRKLVALARAIAAEK